jgi:hypothetical protein
MRSHPAGDVDYDAAPPAYARVRRPDPHLAAVIGAALGDARTVLNVGAGAGSYEPPDREVTAVEPSASMRAQRPAGLAAATDAVAEDLPFGDGQFDAAMAIITVHQWPDLEAGLGELRRVTTGPVVVATFDPARLRQFWLRDWGPALLASEAGRMPALDRIAAGLGGPVRTEVARLPLHCTDGFVTAFYGRPEALLQAEVRRAQSAWNFLPDGAEDQIVAELGAAIESGRWDAAYGALRTTAYYDGGYRLVVSERPPGPTAAGR